LRAADSADFTQRSISTRGWPRRDDVEVTLISRENFILFTPMLHEVAAGDLNPSDIVNPVRKILRHVKFVEAEVEAIAGSETTGAINDFVREIMRYFPDLSEELIRVVVIHPGDFLLPELGEELGRYAERKLQQRKVEIIKGTRVASYDGARVTLADGKSIDAATLIWTAGVKPSPVIGQLASRKEHGRLLVDEFLRVPGADGLWAAGDCAAVPDRKTGKFHPPTAQHGLRKGLVAAKNIEAAILGRPLKPFIFTMLGQLATIGRRTGVAMVFGMKFSGFVAWCLWRSVYLMKLPRLAKKLRVLVGWTLDLFFSRDIEQMITLRDAEALGAIANRIRARATQQTSTAAATTLEDTVQDQLK
jgi:NADH:quinone reductase (non-electrogenic)